MQSSAKTRPAITMTKWICNGGYSAVGAATCPFFLSRVIAGVGALALAGGLIVFTSGQDETKPAPLTGQQEVAAVPAPDPRDAESTSGPAGAGPPPEPAGNAAPSPAPTPEPPAAKPPEKDRAAQPEPPSGRADFAPSTPGPSAAPSAEAAGLLRRARELIDVGDIGAARLLLERAAATNDGSALFALAETYDPAALARWRVQGVRPNVDRARMLYQRALDRGVGQAQERLAGLR